ncbi:MAG TPA: bifunctional precorrin-2 dehydrogenase/sirohydrochlorin ferrochelatase [Candidatus Angelobacter sp.]|nr:bifunctional precorrin-2 dehydrogenase/sirohydrochlorin ferrochelatase [Candidatus Angelobacter sp.]
MTLYPIFLKLESRKVLIVGGGTVAEQKIEAVLRSARDVTVLAPRLSERIQLWANQGRIKHVAAEYRAGMAQGYFLVIAATDSQTVNRAVYQEAVESGALANAVDDPGYCSFYAPAVVERGDFQIAVSTGGASPALAQQVRRELEQRYGPEYRPWTAWLGRTRSLLLRALPPGDRRKHLLHLVALARPTQISDRKVRKVTMSLDQAKREELEGKLREVLKDHQRDGLNMIGNVEQLTRKLLQAVETWIDHEPFAGRKSA